MTGLQRQQIEFQMRVQQQELDLRRAVQHEELELRKRAENNEFQLRRHAQMGELELRRLALDRADANEKIANKRLEDADKARLDFAHRGQTFAMWLAGSVTAALLASGLACVFLTVVGVIHASVGIPLATICLAGSLFAGIANLIKNFLPGGSSDSSGSGDKSS